MRPLLALTALAFTVGAAPAAARGDGAPDATAACPEVPVVAATPCPGPPRPPSPPPAAARPPSYVGAIGTASWTDRLRKPRRLVPCSADGGCQVIRTRRRGWGKATASGRGTAKINDCEPNCAQGHFRNTRGARVRAYRRRGGTCNGAAVRYYTRVRITWPRRLHRSATTMKLTRRCA